MYLLNRNQNKWLLGALYYTYLDERQFLSINIVICVVIYVVGNQQLKKMSINQKKRNIRH